MNKSDTSGIAAVVIGLGAAVWATAVPWEIPLVLKHVLFWVGIFSTLCGCLWLFQLHKLSKYKRTTQAWVHSILLGTLMLIMGSAEFLSYSQRTPVPDKPKYQISIGCSHFGDKIPLTLNPPTHIVYFYMQRQFIHSGPFAVEIDPIYNYRVTRITTTEDAERRPPGSTSGSVVRCTFTNYSSMPLFQVMADMPTRFTGLLRTSSNLPAEGPLIYSNVARLNIKEIGFSTSSVVEVFFVNETETMVILKKPSVLTGSRAGDGDVEDVKLIQKESNSEIYLLPLGPMTTSLPSSLPASQSAPQSATGASPQKSP